MELTMAFTNEDTKKCDINEPYCEYDDRGLLWDIKHYGVTVKVDGKIAGFMRLTLLNSEGVMMSCYESDNRKYPSESAEAIDKYMALTDGDDGCLYECIYELLHNKKSPVNVEKDIVRNAALICYIGTLYIRKEFRGKGIASYLLTNLPEILIDELNLIISIYCTHPCPQIYNGKYSKEPENIDEAADLTDMNESKEQAKMKLLMMKAVRKNGYQSIGNSSYAKYCQEY